MQRNKKRHPGSVNAENVARFPVWVHSGDLERGSLASPRLCGTLMPDESKDFSTATGWRCPNPLRDSVLLGVEIISQHQMLLLFGRHPLGRP